VRRLCSSASPEPRNRPSIGRTSSKSRKPKATRRGRPYANIAGAEVLRLRDDLGLSWQAIAKKLSADASSVRRAYLRLSTTADLVRIRPTPVQNSRAAIPESR
jgi:hypothetical protein